MLARAAEGSPWRDVRIQLDIEPLEKPDPAKAEAVALRPNSRPLPPLGDDLLEQKEALLSFCVEPSGLVSEVSPRPQQNTPQEAAALGKIAATLKQWVFVPIAARSCFLMRWTFTAGAEPGDTRVPAPRPKSSPQAPAPSQAIHQPALHLPDDVKSQLKGKGDVGFTAKMCIDQDGRVFRVEVLEGIPGADEALVHTLLEWRYKPQPSELCFPSHWVFKVK